VPFGTIVSVEIPQVECHHLHVVAGFSSSSHLRELCGCFGACRLSRTELSVSMAGLSRFLGRFLEMLLELHFTENAFPLELIL